MRLRRAPDARDRPTWLVDGLPLEISRVAPFDPAEASYWQVDVDGESLRYQAFLQESGLNRMRFPTRRSAIANLGSLLEERAKPLPPLNLPKLSRVAAGEYRDPSGHFKIVRQMIRYSLWTAEQGPGWKIQPISDEALDLLGGSPAFIGAESRTLYGAARAIATHGYPLLRNAREDRRLTGA